VTLADAPSARIRDLVESALSKSRAIESMDDGLLTRENPLGIHVLSLNPSTLRLEPHPVAAFIKRETTPYLLRVRTRSGREVKATPYHPLFTLEHGCLRALEAEELKPGVRLAVAALDAIAETQSRDGQLAHRSQAVATSSNSAQAMASHLSLTGEACSRARSSFGLDLVPGVAALVNEAARLAGVDIEANRRKHPKFAAAIESRFEPDGGDLLEFAKLIEALGTTPELAHEHLQRLTALARSDIYWDEIISVERVAPSDNWVYDLSIAKTHNFVAGNIIVHNSNIAEAISWVLGEQSPKNLRGGKMEDVIFSGTRDRKPLGMAEVILTFVATEDITARGTSDSHKGDEGEFDQAVEAAERAAYAAQLALQESPRLTTTTATEGQENDWQDQASSTIRRPKRRKIAVSAGERISVGRRLYRTGDSEYIMNGRPCLLRDIQELFAGTGLSGAHYAIIEQGRIGQILSSKPLDRRALIEEAAGITRFKAKKRMAELKLESARQNLTRLSDIISEIERQVGSLKRQAQKARRYARLRDEMRSLLKLALAADHQRLSQAALSLASEIESTEREQRKLEDDLAQREAESSRARTEARAIEDRLTELRERVRAIELEAERESNRRAFEQQQIKELSARIEELQRDGHDLNDKLASLDSELERRTTALKSLEAEVISEQANLIKQEEEHQISLAQLKQAEEQLRQLRQQMLTEIATTERLLSASASAEEALRKLNLREASLRAELERATANRNEAASQYANMQNQVDATRALIANLTSSFEERTAELTAIRNRIAELSSQLDSLKSESAAARHRAATLEELDRYRAYYSEAVQKLLSPDATAQQGATLQRALGTLADFVQVEPQYERLVESLFERELQSILVPTIDDALAAIEFLKSEGLGRGAFLVVGLHGGEAEFERKEPGGEQASLAHARSDEETTGAARFQLEVLRAVDLLGLKPELKSIVERAFPEKCAASVVPDIEAALQLSIENASSIYVTYEGEQVVGGRLIVSGAQTERNSQSLLKLKREMGELRARTAALDSEQARAAAELDQAQKQLEQIEGEATQIADKLREQEKEAAARDWQLQAVARDLERADRHVCVVEAELEQSSEERKQLELQLEQLNKQRQSAEESLSALGQALAQAESEVSNARSAIEQSSERLSSARAELAARLERVRAAKSELQRIENEAEELRSRMNRNRLELYESQARREQLTASCAESQPRLESFDRERAALLDEINSAAEALAQKRQLADELEALLSQMRQKARAVQDRRSQLEVERARIHSEAEHLARIARSELAMSIEDVVTSARLDLIPDDPSAAQAKLDELRIKLDEMGPVNMMALEELEEAQQRLRFLETQQQDILDSIKATEEALAEIKRRSRERFRHAFTRINENFQRMFVELFGGGRGEMVLVDEDDVLESGIDLIAQPPGKRLQNVLLLSGGEKAMAAIALLLAIFQYRPSPFCVLDEVDAPLDEVNIGRFSDKIVEMSRETQFLLMTHNRRTMEAARILYGVTMEEPGVSKLVSVRFQ
jgi:chromosome segregation protein